MSFIPAQPKQQIQQVPFFEEVSADDGWQGHRTRKSIETLKFEIVTAIGRLGGYVSGFQQGTFNVGSVERQGFQVHYSIQSEHGKLIPGRLDVAALPTRLDSHKEDALQMALYMVREAVYGMWFLQQLSPGYAPLMPWMLADGERTISQLWAESSLMSNLLPPPEGEFVDAEFVDKKSKRGSR